LNLGLVDPKVVLPRRYPVEFRLKVLDLVEAGRPVAELGSMPGGVLEPITVPRRSRLAAKVLRPLYAVTPNANELTALIRDQPAAASRAGPVSARSEATVRWPDGRESSRSPALPCPESDRSGQG